MSIQSTPRNPPATLGSLHCLQIWRPVWTRPLREGRFMPDLRSSCDLEIDLSPAGGLSCTQHPRSDRGAMLSTCTFGRWLATAPYRRQCQFPTRFLVTITQAAVREDRCVGMVPVEGGQHPGSIGRRMAQGKSIQDTFTDKGCLYANPHEEDVGRIEKMEWVQALLAEPGMHVVLACAAMLPEPGVDPDHLFLGLLQSDIVRDVLFLFNPDTGVFHSLIAMGSDVCGHPCTVHGGLTSAVIDETTGGLVFSLKKNGLLGPGPAFTARLEVDYKMPIPAGSDIICSARVESAEGRKAWVSADVMDKPGGVVYASGKALYVTPKQYVENAGDAANSSNGSNGSSSNA